MAANISETRDRVALMLATIVGQVQLAPDGVLSFPFESTRVYVGVLAFGESSSVVTVYAITNIGLTSSSELYEFVATHTDDWIFGHLALLEDGTSARLIFRHTLLADYLDPEELEAAVGAVAITANQLDDEIKERFGGALPSEV